MRVKVYFSKPEYLNIVNQHLMNSYIHKCLGKNNDYHDSKNNYSISSIMGGKLNMDTLEVTFEKAPYIIISSTDTKFINDITTGISKVNIEVTPGMGFLYFELISETFVNGWNNFATLSPFMIKKKNNNLNEEILDIEDPQIHSKIKKNFHTLYDNDFKYNVKKYLINKLKAIDNTLNLYDFDVNIRDHHNHKVKKVMVKNVVNGANQCQISIKCSKKVAELLYNIGIGQSTGSGFGTIYKTENHSIYR